jgi:queuosine precursor transporter
VQSIAKPESASGHVASAAPAGGYSAWYVVLAAVFVTCLISANIMAVKIVALPFGLVVPAGIVIFPLSYLFGDVLTEVYGYGATRRIIWLGFGCNLLAVIAFAVGGMLPAASPNQGAYVAILGSTPLLLGASFCAYLVGEFMNSFVLARLKIATRGRWLWTRTIGSTLIGEGIDTVIFLTIISLGGILPTSLLVTAVLTQWSIKVLYEVVATPLTYAIVGYLKRREGIDYYDRNTNFSPILLGRPARV